MNEIENKPTIGGGIIDLNRSNIEHRASWLALIYDEAQQAGADAEAITRKAIFRMGCVHGNRLAKQLEPGGSLELFSNSFFNVLTKKTFEMEIVSVSEEELLIEFGYCPLLAAWQNLGFSDERNSLFCDIAMEGDRGIASAMGYTMELEQTIASGQKKCRMRYSTCK